MSDDDTNDIPTLSDLVFPGNPDKIIKEQSAQSLLDEDNLEGLDDSAGNSYIADEIDRIVENVLGRYLPRIQKEIVEQVMQEIHRRLP